MLTFWSGITTIMALRGRFFLWQLDILDDEAKELKSLETSIIDGTV
jgi:hypothetical protein